MPVVNAGTYAPVCINNGNVVLTGSPSGGIFSGIGVSGNSFIPATAGVGTKSITYTYTNSNGCTNSATTSITVNPLPVVSAGTYAPICINNGNVVLTGSPSGGIFSGPGVSGNSFNPSTAGAGTHTITYTYSNSNGCTNSASTGITVNPLPVVSAGTYAPVCINNGNVVLTGSPSGGIFSGPGVSGNSFNPSTAGAGTHTITYTYSNSNGCTNSASTGITVNPLPVVSAGTYAPVCINNGNVVLTGSPSGGIFSGPGVSGNSFNPSTAGVGTHTITYTYSNSNGCTNSATTSITVNPLPVVSAGTYAPVCINNGNVVLTGSPSGGIFSGPGVSGNSFNPSTAGAGTHTITYTYSNSNGCTNSASTGITVNPLPVVSAGTYAPVCINNGNVVLTGSPSGGIFSGPGVSGNSFDPGIAGTGTHTITYNFIDGNGCSASATTTLIVNRIAATEFTTAACLSYTLPWGTVVTSSNDYVHTYSTINGCDSVVTAHVIINSSVATEFTAAACLSYTLPWGTVVTSSNDYIHTYTTVNGCDSVVTAHVTINSSVATEFTAAACLSYTLPWGTVVTSSNDYVHTYSTINGCDSVVTAHVIINSSVATEFTAAACLSYTLPWGTVATSSNDYVHTYSTINGCDSVVTAHVTINSSVATEFTAAACLSYTLPWGQVVTSSNDYVHTYSTINGCDSVVTAHVIINSSVATEFTAAACLSYTLPWGPGSDFK